MNKKMLFLDISDFIDIDYEFKAPLQATVCYHNTGQKITDDLRLAIINGQISLARQPKVDLESGLIIGYEVLARWKHSYYGPIPPNLWINVAENNGFMEPLTFNVLHMLLKHLQKATNEADYLPHAINISPTCMTLSFVEELHALCNQYGISASRLEIEVTESTKFENMTQLSTAIRKLRTLGYRVSLDDFGNGYASMHALAELEVDEVKIDKSLVHSTSPKAKPILSALAKLCKDLGVKMTLEGIETREHFKLAQDLKATTVQGFFLGKPEIFI